MDFFRNMFGRREGMPQGDPGSSEREDQEAEMRALRDGKFRALLNELSDSELSDENFERVLRNLFADGHLPPMSGEEMRKFAEDNMPLLHETVPAAVPERYRPEDDVYEAMGTRRATFEKAFGDGLGRSVTAEDMDLARHIFEADEDIRKKWSTLVGEEVAHYGKHVAEMVRRSQETAAAK